MGNSAYAVVSFEKEIENPTEWNIKIRHDNTLVSLNLIYFSLTEKVLMDKFPFESDDPDWYSFRCEITGDEFLDLVGHTFGQAREKSHFLDSMVEYRKEHSGEGYMQVPHIEAFFNEVARNEIEKVTLRISENA